MAAAQQAQAKKNAFLSKWRTRFNDFTRGTADYGCPKQFFVEMAAAMPDRFRWQKVGTQQGCEIYQFTFKRSENPYSESILQGTLVFQSGKIIESRIDAFD